MGGLGRCIAFIALAGGLSASCAADDVVVDLTRSPDIVDTTTTTTTIAAVVPVSEPPVTVAPTTTAPPPPVTEAPTTTRAPIPRVVVDTAFAPYATTGPVVLHHPAAGVERIGFHESGHDGAQQQDATPEAARAFVMDTRNRGTGDRTAADIVVVPDTEIRSPVTGTVKRAGGYTLYCDHRDEFFVVEPDARPGWEVKVFHIEGLAVAAGQRVEAGVTPVATRSRQLPFESQVDESTAAPAWPHVHVEVVDPSIPDRPNPGGGGGCP